MKLVVTLIKEKDNENIEPGEVISFNVSEEEANKINEAMSKNDFFSPLRINLGITLHLG